ncbi:MAG: DUF29 domain-containing protein [Candidatus Methylumidiphilus alinenensis]|uniref:DUF29 domain-containing protein n=1 Tax=Candidatus Methylumidiphilus alinenensis TaxID=2202197 RepID=A0A2W4RKA3_9GAMM|nr:MAG: DUF29 domain-containing protein [Candidatus Methylumidiphilus alinenensis]
MSIYETDHSAWALKQVALLRSGHTSALDFEHIAEELEDIMGNNRREMHRRFRVLIGHLLKWQFQPGHRSTSWRSTIRNQRNDIEDMIAESPSLKRLVSEKIASAYPKAVALASDETGLPKTVFPSVCPYTELELLNDEFWPGD